MRNSVPEMGQARSRASARLIDPGSETETTSGGEGGGGAGARPACGAGERGAGSMTGEAERARVRRGARRDRAEVGVAFITVPVARDRGSPFAGAERRALGLIPPSDRGTTRPRRSRSWVGRPGEAAWESEEPEEPRPRCRGRGAPRPGRSPGGEGAKVAAGEAGGEDMGGDGRAKRRGRCVGKSACRRGTSTGERRANAQLQSQPW